VLETQPITAAAFYGGSGAVIVACLLSAVLTSGAAALYVGAVVFDGAAAVFGFLAGRDLRVSPRCRRAWHWILLGVLLRLASMIVHLATAGSVSFPGPADLLQLLVFPALLCGLLAMPRRPVGRPELQKLVLDGVILCFGGCLIIWYFVVGPHPQSPSPSVPTIAAALAFPLGDLVMVFAAVAVLHRSTERSTQLPLYLLAVGWACEVTVTPYVAHLRMTGRIGNALPGWLLAVLLVANFLWATAAFEQRRWSPRRSRTAVPTVAVFERLPYLGIVVGLAVLIAATVRVPGGYPSVVTFGVTALTVLVLARQNLVLRENKQLATTDPLTGLANRARLGSELERALGQARRSGLGVGVLLADLDDFKSINDRLSHAAGDQALCEFAQMLRRAVRGHDLASRLGGDEFAVVLRDIRTSADAESVVDRIRAETTSPISIGGGLLILRASIGVAVSQRGERDPEELMHRADAAMYNSKRVSRGRPLEFAEKGTGFRPL
jgi:diguanylate cyclase